MKARPVVLLWLTLVASGAAAACDGGHPDDVDSHGPPLHVVGQNVGVGRPMPADGVVQLAFDRYLLPITVNRQSLTIIDANNFPLPSALSPTVDYDPVARTVTLGPPQRPWLEEGLFYKVVLGVPQGDADTGGLRAIDRAVLAPEQERVIGFIVGPPSGAPAPLAVDLCRDVLPIFLRKCSTPTCHGEGGAAAADLELSSASAIARTALGRLARGSTRGASTTPVAAPGRIFEVDMPLIDPGNPGNSWLLYKTEIAPPSASNDAGAPLRCEGAAPGTSPPYQPLVPEAGPASDAERGRLADTITGSPMPLPEVTETAASRPLTQDERQLLRRWIQGLPPITRDLPDCGACR